MSHNITTIPIDILIKIAGYDISIWKNFERAFASFWRHIKKNKKLFQKAFETVIKKRSKRETKITWTISGYICRYNNLPCIFEKYQMQRIRAELVVNKIPFRQDFSGRPIMIEENEQYALLTIIQNQEIYKHIRLDFPNIIKTRGSLIYDYKSYYYHGGYCYWRKSLSRKYLLYAYCHRPEADFMIRIPTDDDIGYSEIEVDEVEIIFDGRRKKPDKIENHGSIYFYDPEDRGETLPQILQYNGEFSYEHYI